MKQSKTTHKQKQGFSLIELLVVMAIIAILMGIVIGVSGSIQRKAGEAKARAELADLMNELEIYRSDNGAYPVDWAAFFDWYDNVKYVGTLYTITERSGNKPIDPWGKEIVYEYDPDETPFLYKIGSFGPNGKNENGNGDDLTNRNGAL